MFKEWGFLLTEIWVLLALAALIGLIAGWLIWGRRSEVTVDNGPLLDAQARADKAEKELANLRAQAGASAAAAESAGQDQAAALRTQLDVCHDARSAAENRIEELEAALSDCRQEVSAAATAAPVAAAVAAVATDAAADAGTRPQGLDGPRDGVGDDLTKINGIGPKMAKLCNDLGFWHFDQIAAWTSTEVAWVDHNLEGFKGRVTRDNWVDQAKDFARKS